MRSNRIVLSLLGVASVSVTSAAGRQLNGKESSKKGKGHTSSFRVFETTSSFYTSKPQDYDDVVDFCEDKDMRLCTLAELCPYRPDYPSHLAFRTCDGRTCDGVSPDWPMTGSDQWVAYAKEPNDDDGCVLDDPSMPNCNSNTPNYWVQVGTGWSVCQTHCEVPIANDCPTWGIDNAGPEPYQSFVICCYV